MIFQFHSLSRTYAVAFLSEIPFFFIIYILLIVHSLSYTISCMYINKILIYGNYITTKRDLASDSYRRNEYSKQIQANISPHFSWHFLSTKYFFYYSIVAPQLITSVCLDCGVKMQNLGRKTININATT